MEKVSNPFSHMLVNLAPEYFFGRRADIEPILRGVSAGDPRSFSIHGVKTIGKTTLLNYLCDRAGALHSYDHALSTYGPRRTGGIQLVYLNFYNVEGSQMLSTLYLHLTRLDFIAQATELAPAGAFSGDRGVQDTPEVRKSLRDLVRCLVEKDIRLVVCLDHFDKAFQTLDYGDDVFLRELTSRMSFVLASEKSLLELRQDPRRTSPLFNVLMTRYLSLFSEDEARQLITLPSTEAGIPLPEVEIEFLLEMAGRQPYLLTLACEYLFNLHLQFLDRDTLLPAGSKVQEQVALQLGGTSAVVELLSLFWSQLSVPERRVLSLIAADKDPDAEIEGQAINALTQKSLIYFDLQANRYRVFSELFRLFVLRQQQPTRRQSLEEITDQLSYIDRKLFEYLLERPNQICSFTELLQNVWEDPQASKRGLEAAVHRLRTRIQDVQGTDWEYIKNVRGKGYQYTPKPN